MPLILVVEQDLGVVSRLRRAFSEEDGWRLRHVRNADEAVDHAGKEAPDLLVVSTDVDGAERILGPYARRQGGPGTLALVPAETVGPLDAASLGADAALAKPVTEDAVRDAAEGILKAGDRPSAAPPGADEPKLTSNDIFGDLVAEVEREASERQRKPPAPAPGPSPASPPEAARPTQPAPPSTATGEPTAPRPPGQPAHQPGQAPHRPQEPTGPSAQQPPRPTPPREVPTRPRTARPSLSDDDIERRLERTLSGVLSDGPPKKKVSQAPKTPAAPKTPGQGSAPGGTRKPSSSADADLEALLSRTLSGIELPKRKKPAPAPPEPTAPAAPDRATEAPKPPEKPPAPSTPAAEPPRPSPPATSTPPSTPVGPSASPASRAPEEPEEIDLELEISGLDLPDVEAPAAAAEPSSPSPPPSDEGTDGFFLDLDDVESTPPPTAVSPPRVEPPDVPFRPKFAETFEEVAEPVAEPTPRDGEAAQAAQPDTAPAAAQTTPTAAEGGDGVVFGQYRLLERIGVGGMAEVWKARMTGVEGFQKMVAIKKILPHLTDSSDFVEMFIDEAKLAAQLNHGNIIHIYDLGKIDGDYYIAMEYVDGKNLRAILNSARDRGRPLPIGVALFIAAKLASALDHAHRKRDFEDRSLDLVHRDVSPQNVLVGYEGTIKLCDFGIVKAVSKSSHTRMGALKGKLQYMSPEQAWGRNVDARSDIFAVGILLFEMLTGNRLFRGESEMEVLEAVRECRVQAPGEVDPSVSREVDAIVLKALAKDPDERYQTAGELARRLEEALVSMRPSPGQPELADYMNELFELSGTTVSDDGTSSVEIISPPSEVSRGTASLTAPSPDLPESVSPEPPAESPATTPRPIEPAVDEPPAIGLAEGTGHGAAEPPLQVVEDPQMPGDAGGRAAATPAPPAASSIPSPPDETMVPRAADAVEPVGDVDLEEGGRGGKGLLVVAIIAALILAVLLYWFVWRPRQGDTTPPPTDPIGQTEGSAASAPPLEPPAPEPAPGADPSALPERTPAERAAGELASPEGSFADQAMAEPDGPAANESPSAGEAAAGEDDELRAMVERSLEEDLAQKQEELRRQFEAKERELAAKLEAAQRRATDPSPPPTQPPKPAPNQEPAPPPETPERHPASRPEGARPTGGRPAEVPVDARPTASATAGTGAVAAEAANAEPDSAARQAPTSTDPRPTKPRPEPEPEPPAPEPTIQIGELVTMGPGVTPPQLVSISKPEYPPVARRLRVEGTVVVSVLVNEDGNVLDTRLEQGVSRKVGLNEAALEAARRAQYRPATKDGVRVKMWTTLKIPFRL